MEILLGVLVGAIVPALGWLVEHRLQVARAAEQRLYDARKALYREILSPYVKVFQAIGAQLQSPEALKVAADANAYLGSADHRMNVFELMMVGSDDVVRAFNRLTRFQIEVRAGTLSEAPGDLLRLWAELVLAIRKELGEPHTKLSGSAMIEAWVGDMTTVFPSYRSALGEHMGTRRSVPFVAAPPSGTA